MPATHVYINRAWVDDTLLSLVNFNSCVKNTITPLKNKNTRSKISGC